MNDWNDEMMSRTWLDALDTITPLLPLHPSTKQKLATVNVIVEFCVTTKEMWVLYG
jgi:hypothetical protein